MGYSIDDLEKEVIGECSERKYYDRVIELFGRNKQIGLTGALATPLNIFSKSSYSNEEVSTAQRLLEEFIFVIASERGADFLFQYVRLMECTEFLVAPGSSKYHQCCIHGLLMHSIGVTLMALKMKVPFDPFFKVNGVSLGDVIISALFHDLYKAGAVVDVWECKFIPYYVRAGVVKSGANAGNLKFEINPELVRVPAPQYSCINLAMVGVNLAPHVVQAISAHDGLYIPANRELQHNEHPLTLLIHYADYSYYRLYEMLGTTE